MDIHSIWRQKNSGTTFIRGTQQVLNPIRNITASYTDDMSAGSNSQTDHIVTWHRFFTVT